MTDWDQRFMDLAAYVAKWSKDPSTKVGAVVAKDKKVLGLGYNGFPKGIKDDEWRLGSRDLKNRMVVHAETNAILDCRGNIPSGSALYITHPPCSRCSSLIIQSNGISEVHYPEVSYEFLERWQEELSLSFDMLAEAHIKCVCH